MHAGLWRLMVSKKYLNDYTIEYVEKPNGRIKSRAVYIGKLFTFAETIDSVRRTRKQFTLLSLAVWCLYILPFCFQSAATGTYYIVFPHAFIFIPALGMSQATFELWTAKAPLTREQSDIISSRAPASALAMLILSGVTLACFLLRLLISPGVMLFPGDFVFGVCEAFLVIASYLLFRRRNQVATCEVSSN